MIVKKCSDFKEVSEDQVEKGGVDQSKAAESFRALQAAGQAARALSRSYGQHFGPNSHVSSPFLRTSLRAGGQFSRFLESSSSLFQSLLCYDVFH